MKEEKIIGSVLYTKATADLEKEVEEELKKVDPPQEAVSKILEGLGIENTEKHD